MLILRRNRGESVCVGQDVEVEVLEISGSQVKLGIRAPRDVVVMRKEIVVAAAANRQALRCVSSEKMAELAARFLRPVADP